MTLYGKDRPKKARGENPLLHKGKRGKKMNAFEELKAWCEKHLNECDWYVHPCANHQKRIYIVDAHTDFFFNEDGSLDWID